MVPSQGRIYTSTPVQSAFHYLNGTLHSAGFDEDELNRLVRSEEVSLVIWRPTGLHYDDAITTEHGFYACGVQANFTRLDRRKRKISFMWELRLDYEPPLEHCDNTNRLYHVDLQCLLRENNARRPTENISFHYNNDAHPAGWDVVRNWIRFVLDLRSLNPAWASLRPRIDVSEAVIDSINRKRIDWSSPPTSPPTHHPGSPVVGIEAAIEAQLKPFARNVWSMWALPNISRHYVCETTRASTAAPAGPAKADNTAALATFVGCDGAVDWDGVGMGRHGLRASLDSSSSTLRLSRTMSPVPETLRTPESRLSADGRDWGRLGSLNEDVAWE